MARRPPSPEDEHNNRKLSFSQFSLAFKGKGAGPAIRSTLKLCVHLKLTVLWAHEEVHH